MMISRPEKMVCQTMKDVTDALRAICIILKIKCNCMEDSILNALCPIPRIRSASSSNPWLTDSKPLSAPYDFKRQLDAEVKC
jgi:hypothetical protein